MLATEPNTSVPKNPKLEPQAKLPAADVLNALSPKDRKILKLLLEQPVEYLHNPLFAAPEAEAFFARPVPAADSPEARALGSDDSGSFQFVDDDNKPLTLDRERLLFLKFNYCRWRVFELVQQLGSKRVSATMAEDILHWQRRVEDLRGQIVKENIPLVLAMARRTRVRNADPSEMVSEGNLALLRAVNKFDCARGYKFSTYACRAILKSFSRVAMRTSRYRGHFPTEFDPALERGDHAEHRRSAVVDHCVDELRAIIDDDAGDLSEVERKVIAARFALDHPDGDVQKGKTLEQVGELIGLTKERVRQIQNKALGKLRDALDDRVLA